MTVDRTSKTESSIKCSNSAGQYRTIYRGIPINKWDNPNKSDSTFVGLQI